MTDQTIARAGDARRTRPRLRNLRVVRALTPLAWIGPAIALIAVVVLWPVVVMVRTSFEDISPDGFVLGSAGGSNYGDLFDEPSLAGVIVRTVVWTVAVVVVTMLLRDRKSVV